MGKRGLAMLVFKLIFSIFIIVSCSLIGFIYGGIYKKRLDNLNNLLYCLRALEREVIISQTPLPDALEIVASTGKGHIASIFRTIKEDLIENKRGEIYYSFLAVEKTLRQEYFLKNEDLDAILSFSKVIGRTNRDDQKKNFHIVLDKIGDLEIEANVERLRNEKLYRSLGILLGLTITIILI